MKAIIYKTKEAQVKGEYKPTSIDEAKDKTSILLEACSGDSYTINTKGIKLSGRGVKCQYSNGYYEITENKLKKLQSEYNIMTNF